MFSILRRAPQTIVSDSDTQPVLAEPPVAAPEKQHDVEVVASLEADVLRVRPVNHEFRPKRRTRSMTEAA
jgi:hypothetical protein